MEIVYSCRRCGGLLDIVYDDGELDSLNLSVWEERPIGVWRYRELLPVDYLKAVTLCEGGTGLLDCRRLADAMGLTVVHVKNEGQNPTGSFKDRGMTVGITKAIELGATVVACASTGNTSASLAAYAARAGIKSVVFVPSGKIALGKLTQAIVHGAEIIRLKGSFDDSLKAVMGFTESHRSIYLLYSYHAWKVFGEA
jgi:threonine synthase